MVIIVIINCLHSIYDRILVSYINTKELLWLILKLTRIVLKCQGFRPNPILRKWILIEDPQYRM